MMGRLIRKPVERTYTRKDLEIARGNGMQGMTTAVDHADDEIPGWSMLAEAFMTDYCTRHEFVVIEEVVREAYKTRRVPNPPSERAWGAIAKTLCRQEVLVKETHTYKRDPNAHGGLVHYWKSTIFEGRQ